MTTPGWRQPQRSNHYRTLEPAIQAVKEKSKNALKSNLLSMLSRNDSHASMLLKSDVPTQMSRILRRLHKLRDWVTSSAGFSSSNTRIGFVALHAFTLSISAATKVWRLFLRRVYHRDDCELLFQTQERPLRGTLGEQEPSYSVDNTGIDKLPECFDIIIFWWIQPRIESIFILERRHIQAPTAGKRA